ncbi:hypothetical protein MLTONO_2595 [Mesorhizobium loti]|nr:hypothetical protein MLTONO_2595 [Mesorhizobium loti]
MGSERRTVRFAYQQGWQVAENNQAITTFDSKDEAFIFVKAKHARVRLSWGRTVIAGKTMHFDFEGSFQDTGVALAGRMAALLDPGLSWTDVDWLRTVWSGPLLLKGILHPGDLKRHLAIGALK